MYGLMSKAFDDTINACSRTMRAKLVYGDEIIDTGIQSVKLLAQANSNTDTIDIGGAVSAYIEVALHNPPSMVTGKEYTLYIGTLLPDGTVEYCPMGLFTSQKPKEDDGLVSFTAYDRMVSKMEYPYFTDIKKFPADGKVILQEIGAKSGVPIDISNLSDGIMVDWRTVYNDTDTETKAAPFNGYTYREAVMYLAQMYGKFAVVNRTGTVEFRWYTDAAYDVPANRSFDDIISAETVYELQKITCTVGENTLTAGSGVTGVSIENALMTQEILNGVYQQIGKFTYLPTTVSWLGDPRIDLGDIVTVYKRDGTPIKVPVMSITQDFDGGLTTAVGSYGNTEESEDKAKGPTAKAIDRVYSELFLVKEVIAGKVSANYLEANYATIKQLDAVEARIDKIVTTDITAEYLEANYAQIDMANVDTAVIRQGFLENLMVSQGLIANKVVGGEIVATDVLTGVRIYANDIVAGTLSVERLILRGSEESLVYALNNSGGLESAAVDTLNGDIITDRTITADKIVAESITSQEIDVHDLVVTGLIGANAITTENLAAGAVTAEKISVADLYALNAKIGGFTIGQIAIYNGTNSKTSLVPGIYLGTDAIRSYANTEAYTHIENGKLTTIGADIQGDITVRGSINMVCFSYNETAYPAIKRYQENSSVTTEFCGHTGEVLWKHRSEGAGIETGMDISTSRGINAAGEIISTSANSFRMKQGNYGSFWRQDSSNLYLMLTNSGNSGGSYNSLRPLSVNLLNGNVSLGHSVTVGGSLKVNTIDTSNAISDYIVSKGSSGNWNYWKWASGLAICIHSPINNGNFANVAWGSCYDNDSIVFSDYPFTFTAAPFAFAARTTADNSTYNSYYTWIAMSGGSTTAPPLFDLVRASSATIGHPYVRMIAIGRWK